VGRPSAARAPDPDARQDAYAGGEGPLDARLLSAIPVASSTGPDAALGEAMRYLAELPWAPDAILGNPAIRWRMTGPRSLEASLAEPAGAAVAFTFDEAGDIVLMDARDRPSGDAEGQAVRLDWRGESSDYRTIGPRRVPAFGVVGYIRPEVFVPYFRATITSYRLIGGPS